MPSDGKSSHCLWQGELKKTKKYHIFGTKSNWIIVETEVNLIQLFYTHIHDHPLSWLGTDISIKSGRVKLVLWIQTPVISIILVL
jgi:hypothetical protein